MIFQTNKGIFLVLALSCFFYCSCAGIPVRRPLLPVLNDPAGYVQEVIKKSQSINDVSGYAKLRINAAGQTSTTRNIFFVKRPDRIRIETLGFLSRPALFFAAGGMNMSIYVVQNNALYSGQTSAGGFERIIGMRLELPEIVVSFLGQPPLAECLKQHLSCSEDRNQYLFTIVCEDKKQLLWIDPALKKITRYKLFEKTSPVYEYVFSGFQQMGDHLFPLKIDIHHYTYTTDITLELESLSFDTISDDRFSIKPPQGASYFGIEKLGEPN